MSDEGLNLKVLDNDDVVPAGGNDDHVDMERDDDDPGLLVDELATLPRQTVVDETRLAHVLHVSKRTVRRMAGRNELPPSVPFRGRSCWMVGRILDHLDKQFERAERDAERNTRRLQTLTRSV